MIKILFLVLCLLCLVSAYLAYENNQRLSEQLGQIDSVEGKIDSLLNVKGYLFSEVKSLQYGIDTLLARKDSIDTQIRVLSKQHDILISANDSLMKIEQTQLIGVLEAKLGKSELIQTDLYERIDKFRSQWPQDIQDLSIYLKFDNLFEQLKIDQRTSGGILNVTCPSADTIISSDFFRYTCDFLAKGNRIEIKTYSKVPIEVVNMELSPR